MIKILYLYYDLLNLYGEYGNIAVLSNSLDKNNIKYEINKYSINDDFDFNDFDFIYCGSGTEKNIKYALNDLLNRKESFIKAFNNNKMILFTGSAMSMLGNSIDDVNGLSIFDFVTSQSSKRNSGDIICHSEDYNNVVGFINTSYTIKYNTNSYFNVDYSDINIRNDGVRENNLLATNLIGPLLVKNPSILIDYVTKLGKLVDNNFKYVDYISKNQYDGYNVTLNELLDRFR